MAVIGKKISEMDDAGALTGTEQVELNDGGVSRRTSLSAIVALASPAASGVPYSNADSSLNAATNNVQAAIDELSRRFTMVSYASVLSGTSWITAFDAGGFTPTETSGSGTLNHANNTGATNDLDSIDYRASAAPAAPNNNGGFRSGGSGRTLYRKTASAVANSGGFHVRLIFGVVTQDNNGRAFFGMCPVNTNPIIAAANPSAATNIFGFGKDQADTNLQFMHNDGSGTATKVDTGITVASLVNQVLLLDLFVPVGGASVKAFLRNAFTGALLASGSVTTDLPAQGQDIQWCVSLNSGSSSTAVRIALNRAAVAMPW